MYYKLDKNNKVVPGNVLDVGKYVGNKVRRSYIPIDGEMIFISTTFLSLDHRHNKKEGDPIVFETMVFGGNYHHYESRYCTWDEAVVGHVEVFMGVIEDNLDG